MRFLQLEWHNHERARNAWDIERAEMKAKIAKQEGEVRSAKRLNEQLEKHVKMLENALRNCKAVTASSHCEQQVAFVRLPLNYYFITSIYDQERD